MAKIISGGNLPNIPWQDKPKDSWQPIWRYTENPVIDRNPFPGMGRIFNSAVIPWEGKFKGVFRAESTLARPFLYLGDSDDGIHWTFQTERIHMHDPDGKPHDPYYAYDPRVVKVDDTYYITVEPTTLTSNKTITLPNTSGTIALTSDIIDEKVKYTLYKIV